MGRANVRDLPRCGTGSSGALGLLRAIELDGQRRPVGVARTGDDDRRPVRLGGVHPGAVKYDHAWERLLEYLDEWATAREVPGGIEVAFDPSPGVTRVVEIVVAPADWDDYL